MGKDRQARLLDQIYDASFDQDLWVPVMEQLAEELSAETACMTTLDVFTGQGGGYAALVPADTMTIYALRWVNDNPLHHISDPLCYIDAWRPTTLRYEEWADQEALLRSAYFNEFLRPIGSEHGIMMGLALTGTTTTTMNVARSTRRGNFADEEIAQAQRWQAHLVRAVRLGRQMAIAQSSLAAVDQLIATSQQSLFFVNGRGHIQRMSSAAETMLVAGSALKVVNGVLTAAHADDECKLRQALTQAQHSDSASVRGGMMRLQGALGASYELAVTALGPRTVATWSSEPIILITVKPCARQELPVELRLRRRFGLTPAETRLALALVQGNSLREIADGATLSINTVRAQLSAVFSKTHCRRQSDLVRTLLTHDQTSA